MSTLPFKQIDVFGKANDGSSSLHLRSFTPALGVAEDPVCGSGNAAVAACLIHTGSMGKYGFQYIARQGMQVGRDGRIFIRVEPDGIRLGGHAVTCVEGSVRVS